MKQPLTKKQSEVYDFIKERIAGNMPPTVREIGSQFGIKSPNGVMGHLKSLEKKGYINRNSHISRGIRLVQEPFVKTISLQSGEHVMIDNFRVEVASIQTFGDHKSANLIIECNDNTSVSKNGL